jgi:hypothetical protein
MSKLQQARSAKTEAVLQAAALEHKAKNEEEDRKRRVGHQSTHERGLTQNWKVNDNKAQKAGPCKTVYWVKEKHPPQTQARLKDGEEKKAWEQGTTYKGEWRNNQKHGYGIQIWANGNKYEGNWLNGSREGAGVFWHKDINSDQLVKVYSGNWKKGLKEGLGVYFYPTGDRYEGNWMHGVRQGQGTMFFSNGDVYIGQWSEDKQAGFGTLTKANDDVYEGEWLKGKREGPGIFFYKQHEKIYDGEWVNDIPKCGVYCAAAEFFQDEPVPGTDQGSLRSRKRPIPRLRLLDADAMLSARIEEIQKERQAVRTMPFLELEKLFTQDGLDNLRRVFSLRDNDGSNFVLATELRGLLRELKFAVDDGEIAQLLVDLGKNASDHISFSEFVKAAHLMEDMKNTAERLEEDQNRERERIAPFRSTEPLR